MFHGCAPTDHVLPCAEENVNQTNRNQQQPEADEEDDSWNHWKAFSPYLLFENNKITVRVLMRTLSVLLYFTFLLFTHLTCSQWPLLCVTSLGSWGWRTWLHRAVLLVLMCSFCLFVSWVLWFARQFGVTLTGLCSREFAAAK